MNKVILMGRLTRDPEVRYSQAAEPLAIARYTLAVDRRFQRRDNSGNEQTADFISCVAFGRNGEFAEKYLKQGTKNAITGRIQTGSNTNKDGNKVNNDLTLRRNCPILELLMNIYRLILQVKFMTAASYMLNRLRSFLLCIVAFQSLSQPYKPIRLCNCCL